MITGSEIHIAGSSQNLRTHTHTHTHSRASHTVGSYFPKGIL